MRARLMLATMKAQLGLGQAETGVQARAKMRRATAGQRHSGGRGWDSELRWDGRGRERE